MVADDAYLRDKIMNPDHNKIVGYKQVMPTYTGLIKEDEMNQLVAFIRHGANGPATQAAPSPPALVSSPAAAGGTIEGGGTMSPLDDQLRDPPTPRVTLGRPT